MAAAGLRRVDPWNHGQTGPARPGCEAHEAPGENTFAGKAASENLLSASDLDWTIVYPPLLTSRPRGLREFPRDHEAVSRLACGWSRKLSPNPVRSALGVSSRSSRGGMRWPAPHVVMPG